jgi:class 3 adenylate cyclase
MEETTRKIVAILFSDIAGYTAAMGQDEELAIRAVSRSRTVQKELVRKFRGDWVQEVGDGALCTFASAVEAVSCALEIQRAFEGDTDFKLRIGIHVGDIVFRKTETGYDVFGDGVNIAARVQGVSEEGGICISDRVYDDLRNRRLIEVRDLGEHQLKNVNRPIRVYAVIDPQRPGAVAAATASAPPAPRPRRWLIPALGVLALAGIAVLAWFLEDRTSTEPVVEPPAAEQPAVQQPAVVAPQPAAPPAVAPPVVAPAPVRTPAGPAKAPPPPSSPSTRCAGPCSRAWGPGAKRARGSRPIRIRCRTKRSTRSSSRPSAIAKRCCSPSTAARTRSRCSAEPYDPPRRLAARAAALLGCGVLVPGGRRRGRRHAQALRRPAFSFPEANINAWEATPATPERLAELARWLDSLEESFATP